MNMKQIMLLLSIAVGLAIVTYWFWPAAENVTKPVMEDQLGSTSQRSRADDEATERSSAGDAREASSAEDINWALCIDDLHANQCLDEVTPLMLNAGVDGRQWSEIFDHFEQQMQLVKAAVEDPACMQKAYAPELGERCAAREMFNIASALRYCLQPPVFNVRNDELDEAGITDLSVYHLVEQQRQFHRLQDAWVGRECDKVRETLVSLPPLTDWLVKACSHCDRVAPDPLVALRDNIYDYRERAALLGDMDAARYYVQDKRSLDDSRVYDGAYLLDIDDPKWAEVVRATEQETLSVVTEIRQRDPALGLALMADYELTRLPQVEARDQYSDPRVEFYIDEDWHARAETAAVYKLAAQRLSQRGKTINEIVDGEDTWNVIRQILDDSDIAVLAPRVDALVDEYLPRTDTR